MKQHIFQVKCYSCYKSRKCLDCRPMVDTVTGSSSSFIAQIKICRQTRQTWKLVAHTFVYVPVLMKVWLPSSPVTRPETAGKVFQPQILLTTQALPQVLPLLAIQTLRRPIISLLRWWSHMSCFTLKCLRLGRGQKYKLLYLFFYLFDSLFTFHFTIQYKRD